MESISNRGLIRDGPALIKFGESICFLCFQ